MDQECSLRAVIDDIEEEASYQNRVYDQTVILQPIASDISAEELQVFDSGSPLQVTGSALGQQSAATLRIQPKNVQLSDERLHDIRPVSDPSSKWSYEFAGFVEHIDTEREQMALSIGQDCVLVVVNEAIKELHRREGGLVGRGVTVTASRTDLIDTAVSD